MEDANNTASMMPILKKKRQNNNENNDSKDSDDGDDEQNKDDSDNGDSGDDDDTEKDTGSENPDDETDTDAKSDDDDGGGVDEDGENAATEDEGDDDDDEDGENAAAEDKGDDDEDGENAAAEDEDNNDEDKGDDKEDDDDADGADDADAQQEDAESKDATGDMDGTDGVSDYRADEEMPASSNLSVKYVLIFSLTCTLLAFSVSLYLILGAIYFKPLEAGAETQSLRSLEAVRDGLFAKNKLQSNNQPMEEWLEHASVELAIYEDHLLQVYRKRLGGIHASTDVKVWSTSGAVIFCGSVITTIGWGNVVPKTVTGRMSCIVYAIFGIPLLFSFTAIFSAICNIFTRSIWNAMHSCLCMFRRKTTDMPEDNNSTNKSENYSPSLSEYSLRDDRIMFHSTKNNHRRLTNSRYCYPENNSNHFTDDLDNIDIDRMEQNNNYLSSFQSTLDFCIEAIDSISDGINNMPHYTMLSQGDAKEFSQFLLRVSNRDLLKCMKYANIDFIAKDSNGACSFSEMIDYLDNQRHSSLDSLIGALHENVNVKSTKVGGFETNVILQLNESNSHGKHPSTSGYENVHQTVIRNDRRHGNDTCGWNAGSGASSRQIPLDKNRSDTLSWYESQNSYKKLSGQSGYVDRPYRGTVLKTTPHFCRKYNNNFHGRFEVRDKGENLKSISVKECQYNRNFSNPIDPTVESVDNAAGDTINRESRSSSVTRGNQSDACGMPVSGWSGTPTRSMIDLRRENSMGETIGSSNASVDDEEVQVPFAFYCLITTIYILIGGALFQDLTGKNLYTEGLYFTFVTLSTIGFGDILPIPDYYFSMLIYGALGLALANFVTNMMIDQIVDILEGMNRLLEAKVGEEGGVKINV